MNDKLRYITETAERAAKERTEAAAITPLDFGRGGGDSTGMEPRVAHLEKRMDKVEDKLDTIIHMLGGVTTKAESRAQLLGILLAIVAAVFALWQVGLSQTANERSAIANMLSSFQAGIASRPAEAPAPPQPIIIQIPAPAPPAAP
jgi:hypothetical protein